MTIRNHAKADPPLVDRTFRIADVVRQYHDIAAEETGRDAPVYDTLVIGGGAAGAGVLRDLASRGNARAILVERGPFANETSSKSGKAIHPGIRYLRMSFHRFLLAFGLRRDPKIRQSFANNLTAAFQDLRLVWFGTRERNILIETCGGIVEPIPNIVFVRPDSPEGKWSVFFGISLYELFTTFWRWSKLKPRYGSSWIGTNAEAVRRKVSHVNVNGVLGAIQYWDGKASNDKILVIKTIRDAVFRGTADHPIRALCHVEVERYAWIGDARSGYFSVELARRFEHAGAPERVRVRARTIVNAAGPWVDQVADRQEGVPGPRERSVVFSRGTHLEATTRFIHESMQADPNRRIGLVPLNSERQHYLRPFIQNGLWYIQLTTTDRAQVDPYPVVPEDDEIEELLHSYNELVEDQWKLNRRDVFNVFCGLRPLPASKSGEISVKDISRMFRLRPRRVESGLIVDMFNVKLTEYRWAGQSVGNLIAKELRGMERRLRPSRTKSLRFLKVTDEDCFALTRLDYPRGDEAFIRRRVRHFATYQMASSFAEYLLGSGGLRDAMVFGADGRIQIEDSKLEHMLDELSQALDWSAPQRDRERAAFETEYRRNVALCGDPPCPNNGPVGTGGRTATEESPSLLVSR